MSHLSHRLAEAANSIRDLNEAGTRVSGKPLHWWQVMNTHCGYTQPMSPMEVEKKTGVKPVYNKAMGKGMTEFVVKLTDGKTGPIIHAVIYQEQDGNTKGWDVAAHSSGQAQSAVIPQVKAKMKQMGMPCNGKRPMTSKEIMSGEEVEHGEGVAEAVRLGRGRPAGAMTPAALFMHKFNQLENDNAHGASALLLAKFMGQAKAVKCIELVNKIHEIEGSIPYPIQQYRDQWSQRLWADFDKKYPKERFQ